MANKLLKIKEKKLIDDNNIDFIKLENISNKEIAIVGVSCRFGSNENLDEFWNSLKEKKDSIGSIPVSRKNDLKSYLQYLKRQGMDIDAIKFRKESFLKDIDKFDYNLFSIPPKEADLMDPNQRLFLQSAYEAVEDAGYGGEKLKNSKTGVYVSYNGDDVEEYRNMALLDDPSLNEVTVTGNVKSMVATRISYLLDLKGPALLVDTACSSALTAIHMACCGINNNDCDIAIAGGVKIDLVPITGGNIGIGSSDGRTRAFDNSSDGTGHGEGVAAIVLKPLSKAIEDKDDIYAVIKSTAINQDGRSIGITAPNSLAQRDVITSTWEKAGINPETISYFEAHGTGTKLGDPIEIVGIEEAFKKYTDKKQFCAIGSVKSNLGHLDNMAGMASIIKCILSLKNKTILPTVHFNQPNRKIKFENSPVYIADESKYWESSGVPRRCNVSSFGISGTNCNILLEEAPVFKSNIENKDDNYILALSTKSLSSLKILVNTYAKKYLTEEVIDLKNICYTANTCRGHYTHRLAIIFSNEKELKERLNILSILPLEEIKESGILYKEHKVVTSEKNNSDIEIFEEERRGLSEQVKKIILKYDEDKDINTRNELLNEIGYLYVKGADVAWEDLYKESDNRKLKLPTYPFEKNRCWYDKWVTKSKVKEIQESYDKLFDKKLVESKGMTIYSTTFSTNKHWVLREHKIGEKYVIPGTAYIEMGYKALSNYTKSSKCLKLKKVIFLSTISTDGDECSEVQSIVKEQDNNLSFSIISKEDDKWLTHVDASAELIDLESKNINIEKIKERVSKVMEIDYSEKYESPISLGERWNNTEKVYIGENEVLAKLKLPDKYKSDLNDFYIHPSLLDSAVNVASHSIKDGFYLPFSYGEINIYDKLPGEFYSYVKRNMDTYKTNETVAFDIILADKNGNVVIEIKDYIIKKVNNDLKDKVIYDLKWIKKPIVKAGDNTIEKNTLIINGNEKLGEEIVKGIKGSYVTATIGDKFAELNDNRFIINNDINDFTKLFEEMSNIKLERIIYIQPQIRDIYLSDVDEFNESKEKSLYSFFYLMKSISSMKDKNEIELITITKNGVFTNEGEKSVNAFGTALIGLEKVLKKEYSTIKCRNIDIDDDILISTLIEEINVEESVYSVAYRNNERYVEELDKVKLDNYKENPILTNVKDGVYIIAGGTGGIGLEVAKYLAGQNNDIKICLLSRKHINSKDEWPDILEKSEDKNMKRIIREIMKIEAIGSKVDTYSVDISQYSELKEVLNHIRENVGDIKGVINCAGIPSGGYFVNKEKDEFEDVIASKINGNFNLQNLTSIDDVEVMILCSSIASMLGNVGQSDYVTANSFINGFSDDRNCRGKNTICVNWTSWEDVGMASDLEIDNNKEIFKSISPSQGIELFDEVLTRNITKSYIGELNISQAEKMKDYCDFLISDNILRKISIKGKGKEDKKLNLQISNEKINTIDDIKNILSSMWGQVLGFSSISTNENFYELGGDSIMATELLKVMENRFQGLVDIADLFTYPTINEMAMFLSKKLIKDDVEDEKEESIEENLDEVLSKLASGQISVDEVDNLFDLDGE